MSWSPLMVSTYSLHEWTANSRQSIIISKIENCKMYDYLNEGSITIWKRDVIFIWAANQAIIAYHTAFTFPSGVFTSIQIRRHCWNSQSSFCHELSWLFNTSKCVEVQEQTAQQLKDKRSAGSSRSEVKEVQTAFVVERRTSSQTAVTQATTSMGNQLWVQFDKLSRQQLTP